jgi:hypothetical protein
LIGIPNNRKFYSRKVWVRNIFSYFSCMGEKIEYDARMGKSNKKRKEKPIELAAKGRGKMPKPGRVLDERATRRKRPTKKELREMGDD